MVRREVMQGWSFWGWRKCEIVFVESKVRAYWRVVVYLLSINWEGCDLGWVLKERVGSEEGRARPSMNSGPAQNHPGWRTNKPSRTSQDLLRSLALLFFDFWHLLLSWLHLFPQPINMLKPFSVTQPLLPSVSKFASFRSQNISSREFWKILNCSFSAYSFPLPGHVLPFSGDFGCFLNSCVLHGLLEARVHWQVDAGCLGGTHAARSQGEPLQDF